MFDIGFGEMLLLAAIALIAIGPKQLPEVARVVGRLLNEFKRATGDFTRTIVEARDSTHEMLSETQKSILDTVNQNMQANQSQPPHGEPVGDPAAQPPAEHQMSFDLAQTPTSAPEGATQPAPAPDQIKRES